ncbi:MAG: sporulation protein YqfD [Provencibacterium sp.]|nr:sporulation protein YqfD [Provencibacterium sp.]
MLFVYLLRFLKGIVGFTLTGGFIERFLNLCTRAGLPVFNTLRRPDSLSACTTARAYRQMRPIARKTGVRMRIAYKRGLPFILQRYHKRIGILIGTAFFVLFLGVMSRFIWSIEITGNETLSEEYILENLARCGIHERAYIGSIDTLSAERQMMLITPELSFIAINLRACTAQIQLGEREMPPEMIDTREPCNIIAARTGRIVEMEVYDGSPVVKVGDGVREGELIVSGYVEGLRVKRGYAVHARARVIAEFEEEVHIEVPLREQLREPVGEAKVKRSLHLFGLRLPLSFGGAPKGSFELTTRTVQPVVLGLRLPLQIISESYQPVAVQAIELSESQAREQAQKQLWQYQQDFSAIGEVVGKTASGKLSGERYLLDAVFTMRQDIARPQPFTVSEEGRVMS